MTTMADTIRRRLKEMGMTAQAASLKAGMSKDGVRSILRGKSMSPRAHNLRRLGEVLDCDLVSLAGDGTILPPLHKASGAAVVPIPSNTVRHAAAIVFEAVIGARVANIISAAEFGGIVEEIARRSDRAADGATDARDMRDAMEIIVTYLRRFATK